VELTELQSKEDWLELEKDIHSRWGLDVNVFNPDGFRITDFKRWANDLCPAIKAIDKGQSFICAVAHMNVSAMARRSGKPVIEECDAGFVKIVVPIFVGEEFIGAVGACGYLPEDGEVDSFLINKITGMEEEKIERLAASAKTISRQEIDKMVAYVQQRIDDIIKANA